MRPLVLVLMLAAVAAPAAHAHPFTLETWPGGGVNGEAGTTQVWVRYSEEVELQFSSLKVYDGAGNQIDNRDTAYHINEASLAVSTPPLEEGVYTVASKVLSSVDGHLVPDTFVFAVGDIVLEQGLDDSVEEPVYLPEAAARFPGLAGQTILLGSAIAALLVWNDRYRSRVGDGAEAASAAHRSRLAGVMGASLIAVLASNIAMLAVQTVRLGAFTPETLETHFGLMWIIRMIITGALLALWFATERRGVGGRTVLILIGLAAVLLWTSSQIGHGAATGDPLPVVLDYIHNWVAAVWIGGVAYLCLILVPSLAAAGGRDRAVAVMLPRLSAVFTICLGVVIITGPLLMWALESDLPVIAESMYGRLIMIKLALASGMVAVGGYMQVTLMRPEGWKGAWGRLRRGLRAELAMGVALLGVVALLINGTLPAGEIRAAGEAAPEGLRLIEFTGNTKFSIDIQPYTTGLNGIYVTAAGLDGDPPPDQSGIRVKVSNPARNISPIPVELRHTGTVGGVPEYSGEVTFGFSGEWILEVESQRGTGANEVVTVRLPVAADLESLRIRMESHQLPAPAKPLHPVRDGDNIWISDPSAPRIWRFDTSQETFEAYGFEGGVSLFLDVGPDGRVWFTDPIAELIGYLEPDTGEITTIPVPRLEPADVENRLMFISAQDQIWVAAAAKDTILRYDTEAGEFAVFHTGLGSYPFSLAPGPDGSMWFTASGGGFIGRISQAGDVDTFAPDGGMASPEYILFTDGAAWVSEHTGEALARFDLLSGEFRRIPLDMPGGLPYGSALDAYGNIWVAQHVVDAVSVYSPATGAQRTVDIPSEGAFAQFVVSGAGDVWLVEQQANQLTRIIPSDSPSTQVPPRPEPDTGLLYTEVASPLTAAGILAASIFFVKSVQDGRRLEREIP